MFYGIGDIVKVDESGLIGTIKEIDFSSCNDILYKVEAGSKAMYCSLSNLIKMNGRKNS